MTTLYEKNKLLVEGEQEKRVLPYLLDAYIEWGDNKKEWPTEVVPFDDLVARGKPKVCRAGRRASPAANPPDYGSRIGCRLCAGTVSRSFLSARASSWRTRSRESPSD